MTKDEAIIEAISKQRDKSTLKFITCGSVDDGKSTLLGRLLYDTKKIYRDQMAALEMDSKRYGTTGENNIDFALLLDGLKAEREQGITIDVAYRYFSTEKRSFIVADTPGHEQYTRNMATGASNADLAVILVDARNGVLKQTRRHSHIVAALGIQSIIVAINKMDVVDYSKGRFEEIRAAYAKMAEPLGIPDIYYIPMSALRGDNVVERGDAMPWYEGETLLQRLETTPAASPTSKVGLRFPIQVTSRPDQGFRGFAGTVASGTVSVGQEVVVLPSGSRTRVKSILNGDGPVLEAAADKAITVELEDEVDAGRGSMIVDPRDRPLIGDKTTARIVWMGEEPLRVGSVYDIKMGNQGSQARVEWIVSQIDLDTNEECHADELAMNDLGIVKLEFSCGLAFDPYTSCRRTGSFIFIDRIDNRTVGAGMIIESQAGPKIREKPEVFWHKQTVTKADRAALKKQKPLIVWLTGLSGAGKSTIANALECDLNNAGMHTYLLDGDNLRHGLTKDLGFSREDRGENIRRAGEVAKLMLDAGLIVICAFISPYKAERDAVRASVEKNEFIEIYVSTSISTCRQRDIKGFYKQSTAGLIKDLTGVDAPYEPPVLPDLILDTTYMTTFECVGRIKQLMEII